MASDPKTIAVLVDQTAGGERRLDAAAELCNIFAAHLLALHVDVPPQPGAVDLAAIGFARGPAAIDAAVEDYYGSERNAAVRLRRRVEGIAGGTRGGEWRELSSQLSLREAVVHCAYADLLVLAPLGGSYDVAPWSPGELVMASGVPGLIVPSGVQSSFRRIAVAWNASRVARRAVGDALPFLTRAELAIVLVVDPRTGRFDHGEEPGADIARFLLRHGVSVQVESIDSAGLEVGDAIVQAARRLDADMIVAGAYGHSKFVETVFGSTTRRLLAGATTMVTLLSH